MENMLLMASHLSWAYEIECSSMEKESSMYFSWWANLVFLLVWYYLVMQMVLGSGKVFILLPLQITMEASATHQRVFARQQSQVSKSQLVSAAILSILANQKARVNSV